MVFRDLDEHMLYAIGKNFEIIVGALMSEQTSEYLDDFSSTYINLSIEEKLYYHNYSTEIVSSLCAHVNDVCSFDINFDEECPIYHNFVLTNVAGEKRHVSLLKWSINVNDIIPKKLMKICKHSGKTNISKKFKISYDNLNAKIYAKINEFEIYSKIDKELKENKIIKPINLLVIGSLLGDDKCVNHLYNHLFNESDRIVISMNKNKFTVYDFGLSSLSEPSSYSIKELDDHKFRIKFNNGASFDLRLITNSSIIKENISLKYVVQFKNINKFFYVDDRKIKYRVAPASAPVK